jgi:hypothetical protein
MAQLQKGTTYATGTQVTANNLNTHVDGAILLHGAINEQASGTVFSSDNVLLAGTSSLKKATIAQVQSGLVRSDGTVAMTNNLQLASSSPPSALTAASKGYVDSVTGALNVDYKVDQRIARAGDTMSGALNLVGNASSALQAVPLQQLNSEIAAVGIVAWVAFDGYRNTSGTVSLTQTARLIKSSKNIASVNRVATGEYTVVFQSALQDSNYVINGSATYGNTAAGTAWTLLVPNVGSVANYIAPTSSQCQVQTIANTGSPQDCQHVYVIFIR